MNGEELKKIRRLYAESQEKFAERCKTTRKTISNHEKADLIPNKAANFYTSLKENATKNVTNEITIIKIPEKKNRKIPFFESFESNISPFVIEENTPSYYLDIPEFEGCVSFIINTKSFDKIISPGSRLFGVQVKDWKLHIEYGKVYGIVCRDGRKYLKYIRKHPTDNNLLFLLKNANDNYDDMDLPKSEIRSLWLIHGFATKLV